MNLLLAIAAIGAAIWSVWLIPRTSSLVLAGIYLVVASVVGYDIWHVDVGVSLSLDRICLLAAMGCFVVHQALRWNARREMAASDWLLFGFIGLLVVNTFAYDWRRDVKGQVPILPHLVEGYLIPLALFWMARRTKLRSAAVDGVYLAFTLLGIYLSFTALCEITGTWSLVFPRKIADPALGIHFGRARGPFLQSVRLGIYLIAGLCTSWTWLVWQGRFGKYGRLVGFALAPLFVAAIGATLTRSIWLGFGAAAAVLVALTWPQRWRRLAFYSLLVLVSLVAIVGKDGLVAFRRETTAADTKQSTNMRAVFAYVSYLMIKDRPLAGFGFGHFPHKNRPYLNDRETPLRMETIRGYIHHNTFLSVFVELGIVGFALMLGFWTAWSARAYRLWRDRSAPDWMRGQALIFLMLTIAFAIQMAFHDVTYSTVENGLLFLMAGLMSGMASMHWQTQPTDLAKRIMDGRRQAAAWLAPKIAKRHGSC